MINYTGLVTNIAIPANIAIRHRADAHVLSRSSSLHQSHNQTLWTNSVSPPVVIFILLQQLLTERSNMNFLKMCFIA